MSDPTLQKSGPMTVYGIGLRVVPNAAQVTSFPHDSPPPPWQEGHQWEQVPYPNGPIPMDQAVTLIKVFDRSNQSIPVNKGYAFNVGNSLNWGCYFELHGTAGGSTCLPGVGLFNLVSNPNAWTFIKPQAFDGAFSVSWLSPFFATLATATVGYAPAQDGFASGQTSRLWYAFSGAGVYYPPGASEGASGKGANIFHSASGAYDVDERPAGEWVSGGG